MSDSKPQKFLRDLYKDLDDRHLLLPVIGLVVAIIAVPLLLGGSSEPVTPGASSPVDADAEAVSAAVLAEDAGVRNYRKRLKQLKEKNPFKQQFTDPVGGGGSTDNGDSPTGSTAPATTDGLPGGIPGVGDVPVGDGSSGGTAETETVTETVTETKEVTRLVTRRIDVEVGPQGNVKARSGVKPLTLLPSKSTPVVAFLGVDEKGKKATFAVSADVTSTSGGGVCMGRGPIACEFLNLEKGQKQTFEYGPDGRIFKLKLTGIEDVEVKVRGKRGS